MKVEPTIVTAFFDIKRGEWQTSNRSTQHYLDAFSFWAGIKNRLVVYTNADIAESVREIRERKGLLDSTKIVIVDDYTLLDPELYNSISDAMSHHSSKMFHLKPDHPEAWNAKYNYVMLLKWWCVSDAIKWGLVSDTVAWIDFGFNNCGAYYAESKDFDFTWTCDTDEKINLFCINEPDDTPVFEIVQKMETYVQGCSMIGPAKLWPEFSQLVRESMLEMNRIGFADDDQIFILMAYRRKPDLFKMICCPWFSIFSETCNHPFHIIEKKAERGLKSIIKKYLLKFNTKMIISRYLKQQKKIISKRNTIND